MYQRVTGYEKISNAGDMRVHKYVFDADTHDRYTHAPQIRPEFVASESN